MRRPQGYAVTTMPPGATGPGSTVEEDTFTCCHCNTVVFVKPRSDPSEMGGFCQMCHSHICPACADLRTCEPFEKKLLKMEQLDKFMRALSS